MRAIPMQGETTAQPSAAAGGAGAGGGGGGGGGGAAGGAGGQTKQPKTITSKADYDQLKPGETYIWNGKQAVKKG